MIDGDIAGAGIRPLFIEAQLLIGDLLILRNTTVPTPRGIWLHTILGANESLYGEFAFGPG